MHSGTQSLFLLRHRTAATEVVIGATAEVVIGATAEVVIEATAEAVIGATADQLRAARRVANLNPFRKDRAAVEAINSSPHRPSNIKADEAAAEAANVEPTACELSRAVVQKKQNTTTIKKKPLFFPRCFYEFCCLDG